MNGQLWVQYVSCTPVTKMEVVTLKNGLEVPQKLNMTLAQNTAITLPGIHSRKLKTQP